MCVLVVHGPAHAAGACASPFPAQAITKVLGRQLYAVLTGREYSLWQIEHDLEYNMARGGHEKAVIALHACSGVVVRSGTRWGPAAGQGLGAQRQK
jgi:hypothetical protein